MLLVTTSVGNSDSPQIYQESAVDLRLLKVVRTIALGIDQRVNPSS
jgi:hypothetical protein